MKKEFIVNRQGKDLVLYAGLIDQAHSEGLVRITTKLVQPPTDENGGIAICWAEVQTDKGVFSGIGDASAANVGRMIAPHIVRMAETRAKARALRDAINVGMSAFEELEDDDDKSPSSQRADASRSQGQRQADPPTNVRPMPPTRAATADDPTSPKQEQIDRIRKLCTAVGRTYVEAPDMTSEEASAVIRELVGIFNAQSRGQRKG